MADNKINVGGRLHSIATGNVLAGANEILDDSKNKKQNVINAEVDIALADRYTKEETYNKNELDSLITTPDVQYVTVTATEQTTDAMDVLPATGAANTIYRVGNWDGSKYTTTVYSEYAWNGSTYVPLNVKENGIDDEPTAGSENLVKSGGVQKSIYTRETSLTLIPSNNSGNLGYVMNTGAINTDPSDLTRFCSIEYIIDYVRGNLRVTTPFSGNQWAKVWALLDANRNVIASGPLTSVTSTDLINLENYPTAVYLYVSVQTSNKDTIVTCEGYINDAKYARYAVDELSNDVKYTRYAVDELSNKVGIIPIYAVEPAYKEGMIWILNESSNVFVWIKAENYIAGLSSFLDEKGNTIQVGGTVVKDNGYIVFNGTDSVFTLPTFKSKIKQGFTYGVKLKLTNLNITDRYIFGNTQITPSPVQCSLIYGYKSKSFEIYEEKNNDIFRNYSSITINDTNEHSIVYTYDGNRFICYLDGVVINNTELINSAEITNPWISIGAGYNFKRRKFENHMQMLLKEFIWCKRSLSKTEVQNWINNTYTE